MTPAEHAQLLRELAATIDLHVELGYEEAHHTAARARAAAEEIEGRKHSDVSLADEVWDLIGESYGVAGLHLNGDVAPWSEIVPGGRFERLLSLARFGGGEAGA